MVHVHVSYVHVHVTQSCVHVHVTQSFIDVHLVVSYVHNFLCCNMVLFTHIIRYLSCVNMFVFYIDT